VDQARKNGFSFRNRDELTANLRRATDNFTPTESLPGDVKGRSSSDKKVSSDELDKVA
jgi:FHS family L-fucose permease-like MFS transporter